jgi:hypothetical protein
LLEITYNGVRARKYSKESCNYSLFIWFTFESHSNHAIRVRHDHMWCDSWGDVGIGMA